MTAPYMKAASAKNIQFTLVNDGTANLAPKGAGILLVASSAINVEDIDQTTSAEPPRPQSSAKKPGFFGRLFK